MNKKKIGISTPFGGVEFEWMKDENADIKRMKGAIDGYIFEMDNGNPDYSKVQGLLDVLKNYGHIPRLDKEYQEKVKRLMSIKEPLGSSFDYGWH